LGECLVFKQSKNSQMLISCLDMSTDQLHQRITAQL
jgi:hypothetical protein